MVVRTGAAPIRGGSLALMVLVLAGCNGGGLPGIGVSKSPQTPGELALAPSDQERKVNQSAVISDLASRGSIIPPGSHYDRIANAVLAADSGSARAELRVKRLQAEAKSRNWLPSLGPSVSLTSLGSVATSLLVDQVLFDHGRKKAEREYTVADVEVAAVGLSVDSNRRVHQALTLYIDAEAARGRAAVAQNALDKLTNFDRIMSARVRGGVSNMSEQTTLRQKLIEMQTRLQTERDTVMLASSELDSLANARVSEPMGLTQLPTTMPAVRPLVVAQAEAERERTVAELKIARAGFLPGLSAGTNLLRGGGIGLSGRIDNGLTMGNKAAMEAVTAGAEAADARVRQMGQDSQRRKQALELKIANIDRQETAQSEVARQMRANLQRFEEQYRAGVRPLMDLVNQHEALADIERDLVNMRHDRARARIDIAKELGVLADGAKI